MPANVLYDPTPKVQPRELDAPKQNIPTDADMFGGALAKGLSTFGQAVEKAGETGLEIATKQAQMDGQVHSAAVVKWHSEQSTDETEKFQELKGRSARDALPGFKQKQEDLYNQAVGQATSPEQRVEIAKQARYASTHHYDWAARHAASEFNHFADKTAADAADSFGAQAGLAVRNGADAAAEGFLLQSGDVVAHRLELQGYDPQTVKQELSKNYGKQLKPIIESRALEDPQHAAALYDKYKDRMDPVSRLAVENALHAKLRAVSGKAMGDFILGRSPDQENFTFAEQSAGLPAGTIRGIMYAESRFNPNARSAVSPSHEGLVGANPEWNKRFGVTDPKDFHQNANALVREAEANRPALRQALGREPTAADYWLAHNQGLGGALAQLDPKNADKPAWKNMLETKEGREKGEAWAKAAVWNQLSDSQKKQFGSVDKVTGAGLTSTLQVTFSRGGQQVPYIDKGEAFRRLDAVLKNDDPLYKPVKAYIDGEINFQTQVNAERVSQLKRDVPNLIKAIADGHSDLQLPHDLALVGPAEAQRFHEQAEFARVTGKMAAQMQFASPEQEKAWEAAISADLGVSGQAMHKHRNAATSGPGTLQGGGARPEEEAAAGAHLTPAVETEEPTGPPAESVAALYEQHKQAAAANEARLEKKHAMLWGSNADPAAYTMNHPLVQGPFAAVGAAMQGGSVKDAAAAYEKYAAAQLDAQTYLGVPEDKQHVLTRGAAIDTANAIVKANDPQQALEQQKSMAGNAWPKVYRDLVTLGKLPASYQGIEQLMHDPGGGMDAALLSRWLREVPKDKEVGDLIGHHVAQTIKTAIDENTAISKLKYAMEESGFPAMQIDGVVHAVRELAYAKAFFSKDANPAKSAVDSFTSHYDFDLVPGGAMVPREHRDAVWMNSNIKLAELTTDNIEVPSVYKIERNESPAHYASRLLTMGAQVASHQYLEAAKGLLPQKAEPDERHGVTAGQEYIDMVKANPHWVTAPTGDALWLMDWQHKVVRDRQGNPVSVRFDAPQGLPPEPLERAPEYVYVPRA